MIATIAKYSRSIRSKVSWLIEIRQSKIGSVAERYFGLADAGGALVAGLGCREGAAEGDFFHHDGDEDNHDAREGGAEFCAERQDGGGIFLMNAWWGVSSASRLSDKNVRMRTCKVSRVVR